MSTRHYCDRVEKMVQRHSREHPSAAWLCPAAWVVLQASAQCKSEGKSEGKSKGKSEGKSIKSAKKQCCDSLAGNLLERTCLHVCCGSNQGETKATGPNNR